MGSLYFFSAIRISRKGFLFEHPKSEGRYPDFEGEFKTRSCPPSYLTLNCSNSFAYFIKINVLSLKLK